MSTWQRGGSEGHCGCLCTSEGLSRVQERNHDLQGPRGKSQGQRGHFWGHRSVQLQLRRGKNIHLSICPIQKFTGLPERVVSVSSPELCKERLDKFLAGTAQYGKEAKEDTSVYLSPEVVWLQTRIVWPQKTSVCCFWVWKTHGAQLYSYSELEHPVHLGNPTLVRRRKLWQGRGTCPRKGALQRKEGRAHAPGPLLPWDSLLSWSNLCNLLGLPVHLLLWMATGKWNRCIVLACVTKGVRLCFVALHLMLLLDAQNNSQSRWLQHVPKENLGSEWACDRAGPDPHLGARQVAACSYWQTVNSETQEGALEACPGSHLPLGAGTPRISQSSQVGVQTTEDPGLKCQLPGFLAVWPWVSKSIPGLKIYAKWQWS